MSHNLLTREQFEWFNDRFAVVSINGSVCILRLEDNQLFRVRDFEYLVADQRVLFKPCSKYWLEHPRRNIYKKGVEFYPGDSFNPDVYNTWQGWSVKPEKGNAKPFLSFIKEVICSGNDEHFMYVISWLADLFQHPERKLGTALVLRGGQGTGKNTFVEIVAKLLKNNFLIVNDPQQLVGRFNGHIRDSLLVFADEGAYTSPKAVGKLKNMITSEDMMIEEKYMPQYMGKNYSRMILASNHDQIFEAQFDERRYCALDVSSDKKGNTRYWNNLHQWAKSEGALPAILYELLNYSYNVNQLRTVPNTGALLDHKLDSLDAFEKWLLDALHLGEINQKQWCEPHSAKDAYMSYVEGRDIRTVRLSQTQFGQKLHKFLPKVRKSRLGIGNKRVQCYQFPPLEDCRAAFEERVNAGGGVKIDWQETGHADEVLIERKVIPIKK